MSESAIHRSSESTCADHTLARYIGWVFGTAPADVVGIIPAALLRAVKTLIADILDQRSRGFGSDVRGLNGFSTILFSRSQRRPRFLAHLGLIANAVVIGVNTRNER